MATSRVHHIRDVTLGEDVCQIRVGAAPQALTAIRNGLLSLFRLLGWTLIPDSLRHYGAYVHPALALLAIPLKRL